MKKVYTARNPTDAHFFKGLLESSGIEAQVQGEDLFGARGELPLTPDTLPSIWVRNDEDYDRAVEIIAELARRKESAGEIGETWQCAACGVTHPDQFTQCWQCGADRPAKG